MDENNLRKAKCCVCLEEIGEDLHLNLVSIPYRPKWDYPIMNNVLIEGYEDHACALVHTRCMELEIKYTIGFTPADTFVYHPVAMLEPIESD